MAEMDAANVEESSNVDAGGEFPNAALFLVVGEPFSDDQRELILERITTELRSFNAPDCDVNEELASIAAQVPMPEAGPNGELHIHHSSGALYVDVLINPTSQTLSAKLRAFFQTCSPYHHVIYSGQVVHPTGGWIVQDDIYSISQLAAVSREPDVEVALRSVPDAGVLAISTLAGTDWVEANMSKVSKALTVKLNPEHQLSDFNGLLQFSAYLSYSIKVRTMKELLASSDVVGNIRFSRPTIYIFPGAQGDSTLFGLSGFNLLVNGGFGRKACFWDLARHVDRIDAMLVTHLGYDNLFGIGSVLQRKLKENVHPEIGYAYFNCIQPDKVQSETNGQEYKMNGLTISLVEEGNRLLESFQQLNLTPHPCTGSVDSKGLLQPINLYHKIGQGSLDMYVLNPVQDSKELKEFLSQWSKNVRNFNSKSTFPLPNACGMCALLVWRPSSPDDNITRILFPGNAPQSRVFEGLEKLKHLDVLQHDICSKASLSGPKTAKKASSSAFSSASAGRSSAKPTAKAPAAAPTPRSAQKPAAAENKAAPPPKAAPAEAKKAPEKKAAVPKSPMLSKTTKDAKAKKPADKSSSSSKTSPTTSSSTGKSSPTKSGATPTNTPITGTSPPPEKTSTGVLEAAIPKATEEMEQEVPTPEVPQDSPAPQAEPAVPEEPLLMFSGDDMKPSADADAVPMPGAVLDEQPVEEPAAAPSPLEPPTANLLDMDQAALPEADQDPQPNGDSEAMEQPEALPDPNQFDNAAFEAIAQSANESLNAKSLMEEHHEEQMVHMDVSHEPEDQQETMAEQVSCMVFEEEAPKDSIPEPEIEAEAAPEAHSQPEVSPEPVPEESGPEEVCPPQVEEVPELTDTCPPENEPAPLEAGPEPTPEAGSDESIPVESSPVDAVTPIKDEPAEPAPEEDEVAQEESQPTKSELEDLGIYEAPSEETTPDSTKQLEELGIFEAPQQPQQQEEMEEDSLVEDVPQPKEPVQDLLSLDNLGQANGFNLVDGPADDSSPQKTNPFVLREDSHSNGHHAFEPENELPPPAAATGDFSPHERDSLEREEAAAAAAFDPLKEWGQPMGLPAPDQATAAKKPEAKKNSKPPSGAAATKADPKKPSPSVGKPSASSTAKKPASAMSRTAKPKTEDLNGSKSKRPATAPEPKKRLSSVPTSASKMAAPKAAPSKGPNKRLSTATGAKAADASMSKAAPALKPVTPFYMDLTYIPNHGETGFVDLEFFRRVRARYYVLSSVSPSSSVLNALLEGKQTWEDPDLEVTLIPTYDTETLRHWMALHRDDLSAHKISVAPSASRCTIQLQDQDNSCAAYRLEF